MMQQTYGAVQPASKASKNSSLTYWLMKVEKKQQPMVVIPECYCIDDNNKNCSDTNVVWQVS
jgi:hypothetical protein